MATNNKKLLKSDNFWQYLKENFLIVEEVAELLGVTKWAVLKRTKSGDIPAYKNKLLIGKYVDQFEITTYSHNEIIFK